MEEEASTVWELLWFTKGEFIGKFPSCPELPEDLLSEEVVELMRSVEEAKRRKESKVKGEKVVESKKVKRERVKRYVDSEKVKREMVASSVLKVEKDVKSKRNSLQVSSGRQNPSRKRKFEVKEHKTESDQVNISSKRAKREDKKKQEIEMKNVHELEIKNKHEKSVSPAVWKKHIFSDAGCSYTYGSRTVCVFDRSKAEQGTKDKNFEFISPFKMWGILNRVLGLKLSEDCFMRFHKVMFEFADKSDPRNDARFEFLWKRDDVMTEEEKVMRRKFLEGFVKMNGIREVGNGEK